MMSSVAKSFAIYGHSDDLVEQEINGEQHDETGQPKSFAYEAIAGPYALAERRGQE